MKASMPRESGVSEMIGALLLIAVISLAVSIAGVTILSSANVSHILQFLSRSKREQRCDYYSYRR